jgi:hypothetical protein
MGKTIKPDFEQLENILNDTTTKVEKTLVERGYIPLITSEVVKNNGAQHHTYQNRFGERIEMIKSKRNCEIIKYWDDGQISSQGIMSVVMGYFFAYFGNNPNELEGIFIQGTRMTK